MAEQEIPGAFEFPEKSDQPQVPEGTFEFATKPTQIPHGSSLSNQVVSVPKVKPVAAPAKLSAPPAADSSTTPDTGSDEHPAESEDESVEEEQAESEEQTPPIQVTATRARAQNGEEPPTSFGNPVLNEKHELPSLADIMKPGLQKSDPMKVKLRDKKIQPPLSYVYVFLIYLVLGLGLTYLLTYFTARHTDEHVQNGQVDPHAGEWHFELDFHERLILSFAFAIVLVPWNTGKIPVVHVGQMLFMGRRIPKIVLAEGDFCLPLLFQAKPVGIMTKRMVVPPAVGGHAFMIEVIKNSNPLQVVQVDAKLIILGQVIDTFKYTSSGGLAKETTAEEEGNVEHNVVAFANTALRQVAGSGVYNDIELNAAKTDLSSEIRKLINEHTEDSMGFHVIKCDITSLQSDKSVTERRQHIVKELADNQAEGVEARGNVERTEKYKKLGLSASEASQRDQIERGKKQGTQVDIGHSGGGDKGSSIGEGLADAAILGNVTRNANRPKHKKKGK